MKKLTGKKSSDQISMAEAQIVELSKRIEFYLTEYSVELLVNKMQGGDFVVPMYQREYTWEPERKSRFIESLLLGLPIPFLFFWEMPTGELEIVDGSQRLRTLEEFVAGGFRLGELETLTALSGFEFSDLPSSRQKKVINRSIRGIVLNEHADEQARFDMFARINTGSKIANKAEVRRGALAGPFMDLVIELAQDQQFVDLAPVSKKDLNEREREELVTRFFAYGDGLEGYKDRPAEFIFKYVKNENQKVARNPGLIGIHKSEFLRVMKFVSEVFPYGFRRNANGKATPRTRFESIAVGVLLALREKPKLNAKRVKPVEGWLTDSEYTDVISSDGANAIARLKERVEFVKKKLLE
ncbi:DUF262 domain-containing protein [Pseudomonas asiatica]|uniref:DUF262 domain-containing protein n=1 Tax=Pseudomonas asiatica TaxID=2219225 RepID=A0AAJ5IPX7_9PSED|nr:DUF262 domain-containing protein [Pseudomonas asiatica]UUC20940.1 DUF262 domain-containing protein [Pseudomonas asiatica]